MFRRSSDGVAVPASIRLNDGAILVGTINCGMSGKLEQLLASDSSFIEFVSKDGQQRFLARHQVASVEPMGTAVEPALPEVEEDLDPYVLLGITPHDTLERAMEAFQFQLQLYHPQRWSGQDTPFEFSRYAAAKTRQINQAFTVIRAAIQTRVVELQTRKRATPLFGADKAAG